ncbi:hypothetical protein L0337_29710 [candidate division KSB1 bacterium]|nr:hypothetical protein [candidate division KSB1 bacterium]
MKAYFYLIMGALVLSGTARAQQLEQFGLAGKTVTAMHLFWGNLYAATQDSGVYRRYLGEPDSGWVHLGVPAKNLNAIFAFHTFCPLVCWKGILVGATLDDAAGDSALIYFYQQRPDTCTKKGHWIAADRGVNRMTVNRINAITGTAVCEPILDFVTAFAAGPAFIGRSLDRGKTWQQVWQQPLANVLTLASKKRSPFMPFDECVWAGGCLKDVVPDRFKPLILRSFDSGETWEDRSPLNLGLDEECQALALNPADTNMVYAALTTTIIKSKDGGKSWSIVLTDLQARFTSLAVNPARKQHVLAGGVIADNIFLLYESFDGGEHWNTLFSTRSVKGVSSIVFDPFIARPRPQMVYLATLGTGVFRYTLATTKVEQTQNVPEDFRLEPTFPNPSGWREITSLTFHVYAPSVDQLRVGLMNVLGQEVASWHVSLHAGEQNLLLPLEQAKLTAGVYFIRAEWRAQIIVRKWTVVR